MSGAGPSVTFLPVHFRHLLGTPGMRCSPVNSQRGGGTDHHADGWGIAFFESEGSAPGKGVRYFVEVFADGTTTVSA